MSTITSSSADKKRIKSPSKRNRYCYQLQYSSEKTDDNVSSGSDLYPGESLTRYENDLNPKQQFRKWLTPCRRSRHSSYHSPNELCSIKNWQTYQQNRHSLSRRFSRSQTCVATMPNITSSSVSTETFKPPLKSFRYSYQLTHLSERRFGNGSSGDDQRTGECHAWYKNVSSPERKFNNWLPPCQRSMSSSYISPDPDELCSFKNWPTRPRSRHSLSRKVSSNLAPKIQKECFKTKRATKPLHAPGRLEQSTSVKEPQPFSVVPEVNTFQGVGSPKQIQVSNIALQSKVECFLPPVEIVTIDEEIPLDEEYANLQQRRPKQSVVHITRRSEEASAGNCTGRKFRPPNQSTVILGYPLLPLTEDHNEQFPDDIHSPELNTRRNAVCNELEKETNRVKINGFRMSLHDMRVDLGELTKKSRIRESVLESSDLHTEATEEDNAILEEFLNSQKFARRKAICQEIEKTMNMFKLNGLRMSLYHLRVELGGLNEFGLSDERLEEELNKPREMASRSTNGHQSWKQRRRRTTIAIRKFITDFTN